MFLSTQPYKGTRDFYPEEKRVQDWIFAKMSAVAERFGYQKYDGPMLEAFELYAAKTGEEIVNQQLYSLVDRGERKMAIRPEMTPTLARMVAARLQELPKPVRWYSTPNLWRYERPQRGRLREHWQLNVDVLGGEALLADAEILMLAVDLVDAFGGAEWLALKVNNRRLMDHIFGKVLGLSAEQAAKVVKAADARAKIGDEAYREWLAEAGVKGGAFDTLESFFRSSFEETAKRYPGVEGVKELQQLFERLKSSGYGKQVSFDPSIMRGMDYYTGTVFEAYDVSPENNRAMFGGGRYDDLIGLFGKNKLPGMGFGMGDVVFWNFLETHKLIPAFGSWVDVLVTTPSAERLADADRIAAALRKAGLRVMTPLSIDGFGAQLKAASKHGARFVVLLGEDELRRGEVAVKNLASGEQRSVKIAELPALIRN